MLGWTQQPAAPVADIETGYDVADGMTNFAWDIQQSQIDLLKETNEKLLESFNNYVTSVGNADDEKAVIMKNRIDSAENTFADIQTQLGKLEQSAKDVFDKSAERSSYARARQLANEGFIWHDQLDVVAQFSTADYRRNADLQRAELEQKVQEQYLAATREKQQVMDGLMQDQSMDVSQKQQLAWQIEAMYQGIQTKYTNMFNQIQNTYQSAISNVLSPFVWVEAWEEQALSSIDIQNKIQDMDYQQSFNWPYERVNFILDAIREKIDASLAPYAMEVLSQYIYQPDFSTRQDVTGLIAEVVNQASQRRRAQSAGPQEDTIDLTEFFNNDTPQP